MPISSATPAQRVRTGLAVLGAATLLVAGVDVVAQAADGAQSLILGKNNTAEKSTTLKNKGKGPALKLKAKKGPALAVNSKDLVRNLNAELLGGSTEAQLEPAISTYALQAPQTAAAVGATFRQFPLPAGTYLFNMTMAYETVNPDYSIGCLLADSGTLTGSGDNTKVYGGLGFNEDSSTRIGEFTRIVTIPAASNVGFGCILSTPEPEELLVVQPLTVSVRAVSGASQEASAPLPVVIRQARAALR